MSQKGETDTIQENHPVIVVLAVTGETHTQQNIFKWLELKEEIGRKDNICGL